MGKRATPGSKQQPSENLQVGAGIAFAPIIDGSKLGPFGIVVNLVNQLLFILDKLRPSLLQLVATSVISIAITLVAAHYLFGNYFTPTAYLIDREASLQLEAKVAKLEADLTAQLKLQSALVQKNHDDIDASRKEMLSIADQIGKQIDGFWVPLSFDLDEIERGEEFILPIDASHDVRMEITAPNNDDLKLLQKYLALYINNRPLTPLDFYINNKLRKVDRSVFDLDQSGQSFRLGFRTDLAGEALTEFKDSLAQVKASRHSDVPVDSISVLMVVKRPILTSGDEANLPSPTGG